LILSTAPRCVEPAAPYVRVAISLCRLAVYSVDAEPGPPAK
jgi:hypothetical protein